MAAVWDGGVVAPVLPVALLIGAGWLAGRQGWCRGEAVRDLSNLVFLLLLPALLFRTMARVQPDQLVLQPLLAFFGVAIACFALVVVWSGPQLEGPVWGLAAVFGNTVMMGIPLVGLLVGEAGLVVLLTLISVHALVLLTLGTLVLEAIRARQAPQAGGGRWALLRQIAQSTLLHPVPVPIALGLLWAHSGLSLPKPVDQSLMWLGQAFAPVALVLVGIGLHSAALARAWRLALGLTAVKTLLMPAGVWLLGRALQVEPVALAVITLAAALPTGANAFLFAQRYRVGESDVTATVAVSSLVSLVTVSGVMLALAP